MKLSKNTLAAAIVASCGLAFAGVASALPSFGSGLVPGVNTLSDDDVESFIDNDGDGLVSVGDYFLGFGGFNTVQPSNLSPGTDINELTFVYGLEVTTAPMAANNVVCGGQPTTTSCVTFDLGTAGVGLAGVLDAATLAFGFDFDPAAPGVQDGTAALAGLGLSADAFLIAFEDGNPDFVVNNASPQALIDTVMDGVFSLELGDTGATIGAFGPEDVTEVALAAPGVAVGGFTISGAPITQTILPLDTTIPVNGGGQVFAPGAGASGFPIKTNTDITVFAVPAPGVLALLGAGLLGLSFGSRRKSA